MKKYILLISMILFFASCEVEEDALTNKNIERTILSLERQALDYWSAGNPANFAANFAEDATYFDDIAAHTRLDGLEEIKEHFGSLEGKIPVHTYEIVDPKVQVLKNCAVLTLHYHGTIDGKPGPPWKATSVYQIKNDKWQVVHAHWSLIKSE